MLKSCLQIEATTGRHGTGAGRLRACIRNHLLQHLGLPISNPFRSKLRLAYTKLGKNLATTIHWSKAVSLGQRDK